METCYNAKMENNFGTTPKIESPEEIFLNSLNLKAGKSVTFTKIGILTQSSVPTGNSISGVIDTDVKMGQPILLDGNTKAISNITGATSKDGRVFLKTDTSVYELITEPAAQEPKTITKEDWEEEIRIFSAKGYGEWDMMSGKVPPQDDPSKLLIKKAGLEDGDAVVYFSDGKERNGKVSLSARGDYGIIDKDGNRNGIAGIILPQGGYIRKA
ncbi:MAG: hypothetical protein JWM20_549 [Patescibacteria group bacterium]|nr:hypothetical protein [Patescibacteria group bacterium]